MSKTSKSATSAHKSNHNYQDEEANNDLSDELSAFSSEEEFVTKRKSRKWQPTDAADYEDGGGMYDRGGRRRRSSRRGKRRKSRSRSRRRRRRR